MNSRKAKGDSAEREAAKLIAELTGWPARRKLGAGRLDDVGDIDGVPSTVIQVANWSDALRAVREKPLECEEQRLRVWRSEYQAHEEVFAATWVRLRGGVWRVVLTPEQWATYAREAA